MTNKYYYLVSSLPHLVFGKEPGITKERFLLECQKWLTPEDLTALEGADIRPSEEATHGKGLIDAWRTFNLELCNMLAEAREAKKHTYDKVIPLIAEDILDQETPLEMEKRFENIRWDFIEEGMFNHHFDVDWLIAYFLKIQIADRLSKFKKEEGERVFAQACEVKT